MAAPSSPPPRDRVFLFLALAVGSTLLLQAPLVLAARGVIGGPAERFLPIAMLGTFSPVLAAVLLSRGTPGGVRGLFSTLRPTSAPPLWSAVALLAFPAIYLVGTGVHHALGGTDAAWLYLPENPQHVVAMVMIPLVEEPGWRGFALPRLVARFGPVRGTLVLSAAWAAWHLGMFAFATTSMADFGISVLNIIAGGFVFTWLALRTRHSLWIAVLAHVGTHLNNPSHGQPLFAPMAVYTAAIAVAAVLLLVLDRKTWRAAQ